LTKLILLFMGVCVNQVEVWLFLKFLMLWRLLLFLTMLLISQHAWFDLIRFWFSRFQGEYLSVNVSTVHVLRKLNVVTELSIRTWKSSRNDDVAVCRVAIDHRMLIRSVLWCKKKKKKKNKKKKI
jgi:hypothetical protein